MSSASQRFALAAGFAALFALPLSGHAGEATGTSCADCPNYSGAFSIVNNTGTTIHYQYRWGNHHEWKRMALASGRVETHTYPLGEDRQAKAPTPYVRFDRIGGDQQVTFQEYKMQFHAVGYAGYGPARNDTKPKRYEFRYAPNGRNLDLVAI
jgi:hypothetical protein